ncbi:MAG: DUF3379 family protein [Pseudomonadales bacterium]|nr:DUF3379 family protein [Pseudomonadales bacterium]
MNELEFKTRAYSDPGDTRPDFLAASQASAERVELLNAVRQLDAQIRNTLTEVSASELLAARLKRLPAIDNASNAVTPPVETGKSSAYWKTKPWLALAASLLFAVGLGSTLLPSSPSAADMAFHDNLIAHVYDEEPQYGTRDSISWEEIDQVLADNGVKLLKDERILSMRIKFINNCGLPGRGRGAHLVLEGSEGSFSVFFIKGPGVQSAFDIVDERFSGRITPLGEGDMAIVGEKGEDIGDYQSLIANNVEWQI